MCSNADSEPGNGIRNELSRGSPSAGSGGVWLTFPGTHYPYIYCAPGGITIGKMEVADWMTFVGRSTRQVFAVNPGGRD